MLFKEYIAGYILEKNIVSDLPEIAIKAIEEGFESESLWILAGMNKNANSFEMISYFNQALEENGLELPNKEESSKILSGYYANEILSNRMTVIDGIGKINHYCRDDFSEKEKNGTLPYVIGTWYNYFDYYVPEKMNRGEYFRELDEEIKVELLRWKNEK